ncbi:Uncharacterized protein OBRU01_05256, partial [Operophtera brumata]
RLWAQRCRVLQETTSESQNLQASTTCDLADSKRAASSHSQHHGASDGRRNAKDVIPESRLAQFYGNFYYDEHREKCYSNTNERLNSRGSNGQTRKNTDLTECWMLPEVEYWFRKMLDDSSDRSIFPRRRRQYRVLPDDYFVSRVRGLWGAPARRSPPRARSPPPASRKIRARRRQPRRLTALAPPPPAYCLEFDSPRAPQIAETQRAMGRLTATVTAAIRASTARCPPYRGTNVSRYAPTGQRPARCQDRRYIWWPREHPSQNLEQGLQLVQNLPKPKLATVQAKTEEKDTKETTEKEEPQPSTSVQPPAETRASTSEKAAADGQAPSTSAAAIEAGLRKKRLYSTVLSMSAPTQISLTPVGCIRLAQKLAPGILKLNPKIVLPGARIRPNIDHKFEELEKEALEQYKASDESIDTKFQELEKQAEEQYSNTSCSSGNSAEKKPSNSSTSGEDSKKQSAKFHKEKAVDSVVIYSQNFPDLNTKQTSSVMSLKNCHGPPRGDKKGKCRSLKSDTQRPASDTDYKAKEAAVKAHKGPLRWALHVAPPKKRHLTVFVTDYSSDDESGAMRDAAPRVKAGKMTMSAHGGGDLHPLMRKT